MSVLKDYFGSLERPNIALSGNGLRPVQKFTTLLLCAYKEFQNVTTDLVEDLRRSHQYRVVQALDVYSKRSHIHELSGSFGFTRPQLYSICDLFFDAIYYSSADGSVLQGKMDIEAFRRFLGKVAAWADLEPDRLKKRMRGIDELKLDVPGQQIIPRLFQYFNRQADERHLLSLQNLVKGLGDVVFGDSTSNTNILFALFDDGEKGFLTRKEVLSLSESLLFLRRDAPPAHTFLAAVSDFMRSGLGIGMELGRRQIVGEGADSTTNDDTVRLPLSEFRELLLGMPVLAEEMAAFGPSFQIQPPAKQEAEVRFVEAGVDRVISEGIKWASGVEREGKETAVSPSDADVGDETLQYQSQEDLSSSNEIDGAEAFLESLGLDPTPPPLSPPSGSTEDIDSFLDSLN